MYTQEELNKLKEKKISTVIQQLNDLSQEVMNMTQVEPAIIKESDFITYFLPIFDGRVPANEENMRRLWHNFERLTPSIYSPIEVWTNDLKEPLFLLPSLFAHLDSNDVINGISYGEIINRYLKDKENPISNSEEFLANIFTSMDNLLKPKEEELKKYVDGVIIMINRYGLYKDRKDVNVPKTNNNKVDTVDEDIFDYD